MLTYEAVTTAVAAETQTLKQTGQFGCTMKSQRLVSHTLVEHVRLVPEGRVLAQVLPDHLDPLQLQPLQLLRDTRRRRRRRERHPWEDLCTDKPLIL